MVCLAAAVGGLSKEGSAARPLKCKGCKGAEVIDMISNVKCNIV